MKSYTRDELKQRAVARRAFEAVIWGMPAVNFELMRQALVNAKGDWNQIVYWSRPLTWKNQTLTPNPDTIYLMPVYNTKDAGPMVLEIPPADGGAITGSVDDAWQAALEDVGPAGVDKGVGGKYLILPPGHPGDVPPGYIAMPSSTYTGYALLRANLESSSDADVAKAVAYGKEVKFYPLSQATGPPVTTYLDAIELLFDSTIPYDLRFFEMLDRVVQREPWLQRDRAMIDTLRSIGIERGKTFAPDAATKAILEDAAQEAHAWLDLQYESVFVPPFNAGTHWALPASPAVAEAMQTQFARVENYPVDGRATSYSMAFFSAKHLGEGQFYLMTIVDKDGHPFDGSQHYRLNVPANAPVSRYWSATVYDRATHALIRDQPRASRSSLTPGLQQSADGSTSVFFGPNAPSGQATNWIPTNPRGQFEVLFRLYGPQKAFFEKTWKLPDIEKV
jgi:hypothetical protein